MMNLTEVKKMLQKDFNVKYLSDLEQIELIQNNEDLHIGVVKVELKVAYKYYTIGTFGVFNTNAKVDGRKVKASMTYLNKIATWLVEKQEVDVRIFIDDEQQSTVEPQTIKEETQEPTKKAQTKKVVEVIKTQLSNIKEVTTKNEHYYKIHLDNNYMITAFYSNCKKCYKVTLFDMSKSPKNGENKVVHTLKLQDLTNFKEVYNFCQIVEKQTQEQPTVEESCQIEKTANLEEEKEVISLRMKNATHEIDWGGEEVTFHKLYVFLTSKNGYVLSGVSKKISERFNCPIIEVDSQEYFDSGVWCDRLDIDYNTPQELELLKRQVMAFFEETKKEFL